MSARGIVWAVLLAGLAAVGCSMSSGSKPPPLPPGVDPSNLFNTVPPGQVQLIDAKPYYRKVEKDDVADSGGPTAPVTPTPTFTDAKRRAQALKGEQVTSESGVKEYRAKEREREDLNRARQVQQKQQKQKADELKQEFERRTQDRLQEYEKKKQQESEAKGLKLFQLMTDDEPKIADKYQLPGTKPVELETERMPQYAPEPPPVAPPPKLPPAGAKHDILILAGGGSRSLFLHGVVCGWQDSGTMPDFSVVTGVSGGGMAAAALFGGKEYLDILRRSFLALNQTSLLHGDAWDRKRFPHPFGIGTASIADTSKIRKQIQQLTGDPKFFANVAAEHARGRRLYLGTANLDTQRFVTWDIGAIASEGTPESRKLIEDILLATSAIPPLMEPVKIQVTIDGRQFEEFHVDGGTARNLFFYAPADWPGEEEDKKTGYQLLAGARVHVVLGGKVYETPEKTQEKLLDCGLRSVGTLMGSLQRAEVARIYSYCLDRGMTMKVAAIPPDFPLPSSNVFDPVESCKMFREGYTRVQEGKAFRPATDDRAVSEDRARRSTVLSSEGATEIGTVAPVVPLTPPKK